MNYRMGILLTALCVSLPVTAQPETLIEATETSTAFMNVPTTDNSRLTFKACDDCEYVSVRLVPTTQYYLRGEAMNFAAFRQSFSGLRRSTEDYALVTYETETNTATSVRVAD